MTPPQVTRRKFIAVAASLPAAFSARAQDAASGAPPAVSPASAAAAKKIPVGLELYSVRDSLRNNLPATLRAVGGMGYEMVEFYAPYQQWSFPHAKEVRLLIDDLRVRCPSTHNQLAMLQPEGLPKTIELNQILGAKYVVLASAGGSQNPDAWKRVADTLAAAAETLAPHGLYAGYHNHQVEWRPLADGQRPMDIIAANTPKEVCLQLDVGTCVEVGDDPVAWIKAHPGRIKSVHLKDWNRERGYLALFGEGASPWKDIFAAAEADGGVEYYLIEQERSAAGQELPTVETCLANYKKMRR